MTTTARRDRIRRIEAKRPPPVVVEVERVEREGARDRLLVALLAVLGSGHRSRRA